MMDSGNHRARKWITQVHHSASLRMPIMYIVCHAVMCENTDLSRGKGIKGYTRVEGVR